MLTKSTLRRIVAGTAIGIAATLALAIPAAAHVTVSPSEAPAEGYAKLDFSVGHGCEGSPTTSLSIQMPDQVVSATPQVVPGWTISTKEGELAQPVESHGETITTGVREVTWRGGPLDDHHLEVFGLSVRFAGEVGDEVPFKAVQRCRDGEMAWIEVAANGDQELEYPAPVVTLTAADDDHGHSNDAANGDAAAEDAPATVADGDIAATDGADTDSADDGDGPLPVIALIVAIIALIAAGAALFRRK